MIAKSWLGRLRDGLAQSTAQLTGSITSALSRRRLDSEALEQLEEALIMADLGPTTAAKLAAELGQQRFEKDIAPEEVQEALADIIADILKPVAIPLKPADGNKPHVVLIEVSMGQVKQQQ